MTLRTTVQNADGAPIMNAYVVANIQETGASFARITDGNGYADVALNAEIPEGAHVTFVVQADGFFSHAEYLTLDHAQRGHVHSHSHDHDQEVIVTLLPFV